MDWIRNAANELFDAVKSRERAAMPHRLHGDEMFEIIRRHFEASTPADAKAIAEKYGAEWVGVTPSFNIANRKAALFADITVLVAKERAKMKEACAAALDEAGHDCCGLCAGIIRAMGVQ